MSVSNSGHWNIQLDVLRDQIARASSEQETTVHPHHALRFLKDMGDGTYVLLPGNECAVRGQGWEWRLAFALRSRRLMGVSHSGHRNSLLD